MRIVCWVWCGLGEKVRLLALDTKAARLIVRNLSFATKDDLKNLVTRDDLKSFATKNDLKDFATKGDLSEIKLDIKDLKEDMTLVRETTQEILTVVDAFAKWPFIAEEVCFSFFSS